MKNSSSRKTSRKTARKRSRVSYEQLENRQLLAVSAAFSSGTLTVSLSAANDTAFLQVDAGGKIDVGTTSGASNVYNGVDSVSRIVIQDTGSTTGQAVSFGGSNQFLLNNGLSSSGVEWVTFDQVVSGGIAPSTFAVIAATSVTVNSAVTTSGGDITFSATSGISLNDAVSSNGGAIIFQADLDANGNGSLSVSAPVLQTWLEQSKLNATDGSSNDNFGYSVDLSGDNSTAIIGAFWDDVGANGDQGSAYIFTRSGATWNQQSRLIATDGAGGDWFGVAVSLSDDGNTAIVGAHNDDVGGNLDQGSAYVFTRLGSAWSQQVKLISQSGGAGERFGISVTLSGDGNTAAIGSDFDDVGANSDQGAAYVFTRSGATWSQQAALTAADGKAKDYFGYSLQLSNNGQVIVVSSIGVDAGTSTNVGAAYIFLRSGSTWNQQTRLAANDGSEGDSFGASVAISSDGATVLIGAHYDEVGGKAWQGSAYVFTRSGTTWSQTSKLVASDGSANDYFGISVDLSSDGNTAIIGAYGDDNPGNGGKGSAYVFARSGANWTQQAKLAASDSVGGDWFGRSVAVSSDGNTAIVGADSDDIGANTNQGSATAFSRTPPSNGGSISAGAGPVSITAAEVDIRGGISANSISIKPAETNRPVNLGTDQSGAIGLTNSELGHLNSETIAIGDSNTGTITVSSSISRTAATNISLNSSGDIIIGGGSIDTFSGNLAFTTGSNGSVRPVKSGIDAAAANVTFSSNSDVTININGVNVDTQYTQLKVSGAVDLTGVDLVLSGTYTFGSGDLLTIVSGTTRVGRFNGLDEGATIAFGSQALLINYTATGATLKLKPNLPPTLAALVDLTINEDAPQQTVNLSGITAGGSESQSLRVTASSSNVALIPNPNVTYTSASSTGTISFTPAADKIGVVAITVTVEDSGWDGNLSTTADNATFSRTFQVTVNPVNDLPTLDALNNLTINEDASQQTVNLSGITAGGGETQPLRVTASSNNTGLIPTPTANYTSANATGSISFTPTADQFGVATITVTVEDAGLDGNLSTTEDNATFTRTFQVTVNPINDLPTLDALSDLTVNEDAVQQTVNLAGITAGGSESQPLRVTASSNNTGVIPNVTVNYQSQNSTGSISFTPVTNQSGAVSLTVTVEDGGLDGNLSTSADNATFSRSFQVTVNPVNDVPLLDQLDDISINEDAWEQTINLSGIYAGGGEFQPLRITASSNNTGLIPNPSVSYISPNSTGSISFKPLENQSGIATIVVTIEDGGLDGNLSTTNDNATFSRTFQVTVSALNDIPTLNPLSDLAIDEDAPQQTINLRGITAGEDEAQPIRVTATSSNTALIPNPTLNYVSPNPNGTLLISPTANESGIATITVSVEDGGLDGNLDTTSDNATYSRTFQVTVNPVNDAPTMTNLGGDITYRENVIIARICNAVRMKDVDTSVFINGTLRVAIESGGESADRLWLMNSQYLTVTGNELYFNGLVVGTFSGATSGQPLDVTFNSRASINRVQHVLRCVCFAHDSDNPTATQRTVSIQVNDGAGGQVTATKRVNVIPVNDRPMLSGIPASSTYTLNATSVLIAPNTIVTDPDNANFAGGQLNVRYFGGQDASNRLLASGLFSFDAANNLLRDGTIVGQRNASGGIGENNLTVTFNASATKAIVQEFMRSIFFQTVGGTSKASRYLEFSLTDGLGGTSNLVTTRIDVV